MTVIELRRKVVVQTNYFNSMTESKINHRYQTLLLYEQGLLRANLAANSIGVKERQFFKILRRFRESGRKIESLCYQSHPAWNRTERKIEEKILKLNILKL
jgi:hypothetical protein